MVEKFQIRGDSSNPYHLSVGGILLENGNVFLLRKPDGTLTLPRETSYSDESVLDTLTRGFMEELGIKVTVSKFLGSLVTHFNRPDGSDIEKTTLYFLVNYKSKSEKHRAEDELDDEVIKLEIKTAINKFKQQGNEEAIILKRII